MLRTFLAFTVVIFGTSFSLANSPQQAFMEQFQSSRIVFPKSESPILLNSPGRYPSSLNFIFELILGWTPQGKGHTQSSGCSPKVWAERMKDPRISSSVQIQAGLVQKYFHECRVELETGQNGAIANFTNMMTMNYEPQDHPFLRRVVINLPGNIKLKGLLGLKGDLKPRPLVLVRLGIFSSIEDFRPERAWMMMLFEQSPFNVLFLENMSSADFVANNSQFSFGGYDEGIQNILVARLLQNSDEPLSKLVQSVHVFGVSLGGHGVLFSSLLNKYNSSKRHLLIQSFTALCPVVDLQSTMRSLTQGGVTSTFVDIWSRQRLKGLDTKIPTIHPHESFAFLPQAISEVARTYRGGLSYVSSVRLPPGMVDSSQFWELNDFWRYYKKVAQPVLIFANQQDPAVPFALNSLRIISKNLPMDSKNIRVIELPQGVHCTLPVAYDWEALASIFQSYILSHSAGFKMTSKVLDVDLSDEEWTGFLDAQSKVEFEVQEPDKTSNFVAVELTLINSAGKEKLMSLSLPLSQFDFRFHNAKMTSSEQGMIVRWLNQNLHFELQSQKGNYFLRTSWDVAL